MGLIGDFFLPKHVLKTATKIAQEAVPEHEQDGKSPVQHVMTNFFDQAMKSVGPAMEVRPRRVGGATYQVPMEVPTARRTALAIRWILSAARSRSGKSFPEKLAAELMEAATNQGAAIRKREETHKMAEANRAFSHYRL